MIKNLTFAILAAGAVATASAATANAPQVIIPKCDLASGAVIRGLSNNGNYGVAAVASSDDGTWFEMGAVIYDFTNVTGTTPKMTVLPKGPRDFFEGAFDVTDDGKIVVGTYGVIGDNNPQPAICRNINGTWTWQKLPLPENKERTILDMAYDQPMTVTINGGEAQAITPDGKYVVGKFQASTYFLFEEAAMWDISDPDNPKLMDVNFPKGDLYGRGFCQSRATEISDDGRYIFGINYFSGGGYAGFTYVYDRVKDEVIVIDKKKNADGSYSNRLPGYGGVEIDGYNNKTLTSDGHYFAGGTSSPANENAIYPFIFDVWNQEFKVFDDGIHEDVAAWSVTKDGIMLAANNSSNLYSDAAVVYDDFLFMFSDLYENVYNMRMEQTYGIDVTGKPTLVSDDGRTIVFITGQHESYVIKLKEPLTDGLDRINLMNTWSASPANNTQMTSFTSATLTFPNQIECDASKYSQVQLLDSKGNVVRSAVQSGGLVADGYKLNVNFRSVALNADEKYTLVIPADVCWVKGRPQSKNAEIRVNYIGREDVPVKVKSIKPEEGTALANLSLSDNPIQVFFDATIKINGDVTNRPYAHLYLDENEVPYATLMLDVDAYTNSLVIYPNTTIYLYKGSDYRIDVPAGAVVDPSGAGPNEAFSISYSGSYVPQLGDEMYLFRSEGADMENWLFYEGDYGIPTAQYQQFGFENTGPESDQFPWWVVKDNENSTDWAWASHSCYVDGRASDDWMVTRQLKVPDDVPVYLSFKGQSYKMGKQDYLKVIVYENNDVINQLTSKEIDDMKANGVVVFNEKLDPGKTEEGIVNEWTDYSVNLADYAGKNIYIAFVNQNQNQSMIMVDDIFVVKEVKAFITMTSPQSVVDQTSAKIAGMVTVASEIADYNDVDLSMTLLDGEGKEVSTLTETGLTLENGDVYSFEFPQDLPVTVGKINSYTIQYTIGDDELVYDGEIRDLAFSPVKRVLVEEMTGRTCSNCPLGILAMENLESRFPGQIVPVALHGYGGDPKGNSVVNYYNTVFNGNTSAPNGRINRRDQQTAPMYSSANSTKFHYSMNEVPGAEPVWLDVVQEELNEPTFLEIELVPRQASKGYVSYTANVKSALDLEDQNIRVLGLLLEDGLDDFQFNGFASTDAPELGEFAKGGAFGQTTIAHFEFNNVARGYWGTSVNGTANLVPHSLESNKVYPVDINYAIPSAIQNSDNIKMAVVLIDENTGKVINAIVEGADLSGIEDVIADEIGTSLDIARVGNQIVVAGAGDLQVAVYSLDGRMLKSVSGNGSLSFSLDGYHGVAIVKAAGAGESLTKKVIL